MDDLHKVIQGLQCHSEPKQGIDECFCEMCPYDELTCGLDVPADALSLLKAQRWVSVKDRLPEGRINPNTNNFEYVLCATTFGDVRAYQYGTMDGNTEAHFWRGFGIMDKYVTHWMPLPEPPKEGLDDNG